MLDLMLCLPCISCITFFLSLSAQKRESEIVIMISCGVLPTVDMIDKYSREKGYAHLRVNKIRMEYYNMTMYVFEVGLSGEKKS